MEAISDGVVAVAITLLVFDLALRPPGSPFEQFVRAWPSYLAYLISFLTIGGVWIAHNGLTEDLDHVDPIFLRLNVLFLLAVAFLPYPTRLVANALEKGTSWERMGAVVYGCTLLIIRVLFGVLSAYSRHERLRRTGIHDPDLHEAQKKFGFAVCAYAVTILLGLVFPVVSITLYFAIAVYMIVPFRAVAREVFRKRAT